MRERLRDVLFGLKMATLLREHIADDEDIRAEITHDLCRLYLGGEFTALELANAYLGITDLLNDLIIQAAGELDTTSRILN